MSRISCIAICCALTAAVLPALSANPPVFSLDDNPAIPAMGPPGPIPGFGSEDPWGRGLVPPPGYAPSPTLPAIPAQDASILMPMAGGLIPAMHFPMPGPNYASDFSTNRPQFNTVMSFEFSVDRVSRGIPGTAVWGEALVNQQPGDIYRGTKIYRDPAMFCGTLIGGGGPFWGVLPSAGGIAVGNNTLLYNQSFLGLTAVGLPGVLTPPGVPTPPLQPGMIRMKDNVDGYNRDMIDINGDGLSENWLYWNVTPDVAVLFPPLNPGDILDIAPGAGPTPGAVYATPAQMGLVPLGNMQGQWFGDHIDSLVLWDRSKQGSQWWGGPGAQPIADYALFSLSPGSASLAMWGLSPADVFFTDFTGKFAVYAWSNDLGLLGGDNLDALDVAIFLPGDADHDGDVDFTDYQILESNFGLTVGGTWETGDFDGDGDVDFSDYQNLEAYFGSSIPEPCTLVLLAGGIVSLLRRR